MDDMPDFWRSQCPERGAGLHHAHSASCDPGEGGHPGSGDIHRMVQCCHCLLTPREAREAREQWEKEEAARPAPDLRVLALDSGECNSYKHGVKMTATPLIGVLGYEWLACEDCGVMQEPKLATGVPSGPHWGIGRGWVSPRMQRRWEAIAHRLAGQQG